LREIVEDTAGGRRVRVLGGLLVAAAAILAVVLGTGAAGASSGPGPEPNFAATIAQPRPCALDTRDPYQKKFYKLEGWKAPDYVRYPGACERLRFAYGPILVKPGQNDVLVTPVTIEKPSRDGYITRFKPNLMRPDGTVPPVEQVHLHHGTWLSEPSYGSGPFFAAGEEKTIAPFPRGYGMPIRATDQWQLLYMVHSAVANPMEVICWQCRIVILAHGSTKVGKRSAKTFREHSGLRQENLRTVRTNWTQRPAQGASRRVRR